MRWTVEPRKSRAHCRARTGMPSDHALDGRLEAEHHAERQEGEPARPRHDHDHGGGEDARHRRPPDDRPRERRRSGLAAEEAQRTARQRQRGDGAEVRREHEHAGELVLVAEVAEPHRAHDPGEAAHLGQRDQSDERGRLRRLVGPHLLARQQGEPEVERIPPSLGALRPPGRRPRADLYRSTRLDCHPHPPSRPSAPRRRVRRRQLRAREHPARHSPGSARGRRRCRARRRAARTAPPDTPRRRAPPPGPRRARRP